MKISEIKPPKRVVESFDSTVFLAGAIDMGSAEDWQTALVKHLEKCDSGGKVNSLGVFNPRRDGWDNSWDQDLNNSQFFEQVCWELSHIENCDVAVVYFSKESKAPITLMELGKLSEIKAPQDIIVFCPEGYHRKGNVDVLCYTKGIAVHTELESFYSALTKALCLEEPESVSESVEDTDLGSCGLSPIDETEESVPSVGSLEESVEIELFATTEIAEFGDSNLLVVSEYDEVQAEDSCIMGNVTFRDKKFFAGICKEGETAKVNLYFKRDGQRVSESFTIVKTSEDNPEEKIVLAKNR